MKILHITNDYSGSTVYKNLIQELDKLGAEQVVYNPVREKNRIGKNAILFTTAGSKIIYRDILNYHIDRAFFPLKLQKILKDIEEVVDCRQFDCIHAHTWYSDGSIAFELFKKYNIPYLVTIRNTDLNLFQERLVYLRTYGRKILKNAEKVILISASYEQRILDLNSLRPIKAELKNKLKVIPNGVDSYWIQNAVSEKRKDAGNPFALLFVGNFSTGKNVVALIKAVELLREQNKIDIKLHLVGGGSNKEKEVLSLIKQKPNLFHYHGKIYDKEKLATLFQSVTVFTMPSKRETFGLVYVEAMLQGLPILYTAGEGIDGYYEEEIGEKVNTGTKEEIKGKLLLMYKNYQKYELNIPLIKKNHDWKLITQKYIGIYKQIIKQNKSNENLKDNIVD